MCSEKCPGCPAEKRVGNTVIPVTEALKSLCSRHFDDGGDEGKALYAAMRSCCNAIILAPHLSRQYSRHFPSYLGCLGYLGLTHQWSVPDVHPSRCPALMR